MPVSCKLRGGKWRLVEPDGSVAMAKDNPRDGGGHSSEGECQAQARAINATLAGKSMARKGRVFGSQSR